MRKPRAKISLAIEPWETSYNGPAIYSLIDENGFMYVGQARRLQNRLDDHRRFLNQAVKGVPPGEIPEGKNLLDAACSGVIFHVEILKRFFDFEATPNILRYWERYYFKKYRRLCIYNSGPVPSQGYWNKNNDIPFSLK